MYDWFRPGRIWAVGSKWQASDGSMYTAWFAVSHWVEFTGNPLQWRCMN